MNGLLLLLALPAPFELPSSMEAVVAQHPDVPHDSRAPQYPIGFGGRY